MTNYYSPTETDAWCKLKTLAQDIESEKIIDLFVKDPKRLESMSVDEGELFLDFSKNLISKEVWKQLVSLAEESDLISHRESMFSGDPINTSENRAVLHAALRTKEIDANSKEDMDRAKLVKTQLDHVRQVSEKIRKGHWFGSTGKPITDIINIGIGGSDLGPKLACRALEEFSHEDLILHFISNVDGAEILSTLSKLNPETTLVIIASKTFTTQETLLNANTVIDWFKLNLGLSEAQRTSHFIALTANSSNAKAYGIPQTQILEFAEWVGGRYSLWSSIGLSISICIGFDRFLEMLEGAREMDLHFQTAPLSKNMPVILALIGIWYSNFLNAQSMAVIPYCERLALLPSYLQQLDMESNGKSITLDNEKAFYNTGPIVWGQTGTNGQHAFFQLLHQGTRMVPIDFISSVHDNLSNKEHHRVLLGNMLGQAAALMSGQDAPADQPYRYYSGNKPSNILLLKSLSPKNFGSLIALYEHKVFVQGSIWNINSFDQWGVELGKKMANRLLDTGRKETMLDPSTKKLFEHIDDNN
jgi:glucose-6-phosphate isomerase